MVFGYLRVSTKSQKLDLQIDSLLKNGVSSKNMFSDIASGVKTERPGLDELLSKLREGDTVVVWKMDRIARSLSHLVKLMEDFNEKGVHFKSIQESFIDTTSSYGKFIFAQFAAFAQLERDLLVERTKAGLESTRRRGTKLGRKPGMSKEAKQKAILAEKYYRDNDLAITEIMKLIEINSKRTLYKYLAYQGRRNCKTCNKIIWDKEQPMYDSYCKQHKRVNVPRKKKG